MTTAYRVPVMEKFSWQEPVTNIVSAQPTATPGVRYIVGDTPTGADWAINATKNQIAWYSGSAWKFDTPALGWRSFNVTDSNFYTYTTAGWSSNLVLGDLTINGNDITSVNPIDWHVASDVSAFEFVTGDLDKSLLNINSVPGEEEVTVGVDFTVLGTTVDFSNSAKIINIAQDATAISFNTTSGPIMVIDSRAGAEVVTITNDLTISGNLIVNGQTTTVNTTELTVTDKLITINKGGTNPAGSGIEIEGTDSTSYFKLGDIDSTLWKLAASDGKVLTVDINANSTLDISANLTVTGASKINQDVTKEVSPTFVGLNLTTGKVVIDSTSSSAFVLNDGVNDLFVVDASTKKVTINSALVINVSDITMKKGGTIVDGLTDMTFTDVGATSVTVKQARNAYDGRAQFDSALNCIVFLGIDAVVA
jgi:hypothetical protein